MSFTPLPCSSNTGEELISGLCLSDGTPIAVIFTANELTGWTNLLTGVTTLGNLPAGTTACQGQGPPGPTGPAGGGAETLTFDQPVASALWVIDHGFSYFPQVTTVDSSGREVFGDVTYTSPTQITIEFSGAFAGKAHLS